MGSGRSFGGGSRPLYTLTSLQGVESTIRGLEELRAKMPQALVAAVQKATEEAAGRARAAAPRRTGALRTAIRTKYFDDGETGSVFVAPVEEPWQTFSPRRQAGVERKAQARGLTRATTRGKNFPRWIEFGTRRMEARPYLLPASAAAFQRLVRTAEDLVARLVRDSET